MKAEAQAAEEREKQSRLEAEEEARLEAATLRVEEDRKARDDESSRQALIERAHLEEMGRLEEQNKSIMEEVAKKEAKALNDAEVERLEQEAYYNNYNETEVDLTGNAATPDAAAPTTGVHPSPPLGTENPSAPPIFSSSPLVFEPLGQGTSGGSPAGVWTTPAGQPSRPSEARRSEEWKNQVALGEQGDMFRLSDGHSKKKERTSTIRDIEEPGPYSGPEQHAQRPDRVMVPLPHGSPSKEGGACCSACSLM